MALLHLWVYRQYLLYNVGIFGDQPQFIVCERLLCVQICILRQFKNPSRFVVIMEMDAEFVVDVSEAFNASDLGDLVKARFDQFRLGSQTVCTDIVAAVNTRAAKKAKSNG